MAATYWSRSSQRTFRQFWTLRSPPENTGNGIDRKREAYGEKNDRPCRIASYLSLPLDSDWNERRRRRGERCRWSRVARLAFWFGHSVPFYRQDFSRSNDVNAHGSGAHSHCSSASLLDRRVNRVVEICKAFGYCQVTSVTRLSEA